MINYINYTNKLGLTFAIKQFEEFTWMKEKYKEIFIDDLKYKTKIENIISNVPNTFEQLLEIAVTNNSVANIIEELFCYIYSNNDDSITLLSDVSKKNLYMVSGSQINYEAKIENIDDYKNIYLLNSNLEDYIDIFGHKISFHINNDFN